MTIPKQDERTPGPWYHDGCGTIFIDTRAQECCGRGDGRGECCGVPNVVGDYGPIATASKADAEFIVQACNAYGSTDALREAARKAHDTLLEINTSNYDHDDVCELNSASVEAILILADALGERHGKSEQWWNERRTALSGSPAPSTECGWIVANGRSGNGEAWRYWTDLGPSWTSDREIATRYARREDAEAVHAGDEDAWIVQPYTRTALAGVTAPDIIEELIIAAYKRGFHWCVENASDPEAAAYVGKAARDYADKTMNAPSAGVTAPSKVDGK